MPDEERILLDLARLGGLEIEGGSTEEVARTWKASALNTYADILSPSALDDFRDATWELISRSATLVLRAARALAAHALPDYVSATALIGSAARAEAADESDADWNFLLRDDAPGRDVPVVAHDRGVAAYCRDLATRDRTLRRELDFDGLIQRLAATGYRPKPAGEGQAAGERARFFAAPELAPEFPGYARTGVALPVLTASFPLSTPTSSPERWDELQTRAAVAVESGRVPPGRYAAALAALCRAAEALSRLRDSRLDSSSYARHAAHAAMAGMTTALLALQDGPAGALVPYWYAPARLRALSDDVRETLVIAGYAVARSRVRRLPPGDAAYALVRQGAAAGIQDLVHTEPRILRQEDADTLLRVIGAELAREDLRRNERLCGDFCR
ncbi:MAG TPA: hypothetical protein VGM69_17895 [Chloroflexota bacterium]